MTPRPRTDAPNDPATIPRPGLLRRVAWAVGGTRPRLAVSLSVILLLAIGGVIGALHLARENQFRRAQRAAAKWDELYVHAGRQDMTAVRADLAAIAELTPDDANLARWQTALDT